MSDKKTLKIFEELKIYIDPSSSYESFSKWFKYNIIIKDPVLFFDFKNDGIVYVRNKLSGEIEQKFRVQCLDKVDDELAFDESEEEDDSNIVTDPENGVLNPNDITKLSSAVQAKNQLQQAGLGQTGDKASQALSMYGKAMDQVIANTTATAQKILNGK